MEIHYCRLPFLLVYNGFIYKTVHSMILFNCESKINFIRAKSNPGFDSLTLKYIK